MAMHTFTSSTTPAPDPTTTSQPVPPDVDARNSIPFSFLIAFLALFVAFMAMGLWARRIIFIVRRRLGLPIPEPPQRRTDSKPKRPMVWDICPGKGRESIRWDNMQPLSIWFRRDTPPQDISNQPSTITTATPSPAAEVASLNAAQSLASGAVPSRFTRSVNAAPIPIPRARTGHGNHVPLYNNFIGTWGAYYRPNAPRSNAARNSKTRDKVKALQVAVFVAMPSEDRERQQHDAAAEMEHDELAIGIAEVPWLKGDLVSDGD